MSMSTDEIKQFTGRAVLDINNPGNDHDFTKLVLDVLAVELRYVQLSNGLQVREDVTTWLHWLLAGGTRPRHTKRTQDVRGYKVTNTILWEALVPYLDLIDLDHPGHFALIERLTRPLAQTRLDSEDEKALKALRKQS